MISSVCYRAEPYGGHGTQTRPKRPVLASRPLCGLIYEQRCWTVQPHINTNTHRPPTRYMAEANGVPHPRSFLSPNSPARSVRKFLLSSSTYLLTHSLSGI